MYYKPRNIVLHIIFKETFSARLMICYLKVFDLFYMTDIRLKFYQTLGFNVPVVDL